MSQKTVCDLCGEEAINTHTDYTGYIPQSDGEDDLRVSIKVQTDTPHPQWLDLCDTCLENLIRGVKGWR